MIAEPDFRHFVCTIGATERQEPAPALHALLVKEAQRPTPIRLDRAAHLKEAEDCLSPEELARAARFKRPIDRDRYILAHGSLRILLGARLGREPGALTFVTTPKGKPELGGAAPLTAFSLSYGNGCFAIAIGARAVGIDIEAEDDRVALEGVAARLFAADEQAEIATLFGAALRRRFFELWTRKEAVAKAAGDGIAAMPHFSALTDVVRVETRGGGARSFFVRSLPAPDGHALAVAVFRDSSADF